eukprot:CAMPEP_0171471968 /NCGR_PEP_ID=MMETSP0946-20130122/1012_1 /TAXON_ID=109269 /ORGANISM="Vaucheria litorea, Strain CCMP2940" /LENGTH=481 /DNA_ID=CAMNT_0012001543 /DNA_START=87 /DNA_END=1529 /DNA_ORIENTATION=-
MNADSKHKGVREKKTSKIFLSIAATIIIFLSLYIHFKLRRNLSELSIDNVQSVNIERSFIYFKTDQRKIENEVFGNGEKGISSKIPSTPRNLDDIHVLFSTDCSEYQNWQSLLLFYSAGKANHKGPITRLASGCTDDEVAALQKIVQLLPPHHSVHFTPDFSIDKNTGKRYPYYNKPRALKHFLSESMPPVEETVIALLDPDMIFMRPLRPLMGLEDSFEFVKEGFPAGQRYGLNQGWAKWDDLPDIVKNPSSPALNISINDSYEHYLVGPPYLAHTRDMKNIAEKWVEFVEDAYKGHPSILSEMYAFCIAAAHLRLPHKVLNEIMISDSISEKEGWDLIKKIDDKDICDVIDTPLIGPVSNSLPVVMHYCQRYAIGIYFFGKRRKELQNIFSCDSPYLEEPPSHVGELRVKVLSGKVEDLSATKAQRNSFATCLILKMLNLALRDFRRASCPGEAYEKGLENYLKLTDMNENELADVEKW